jgi:signal transduction histidine kinase
MIDWRARCELLERELGALVEALCHDLRAPLRAAEGFSRALLASGAAAVDDRTRDYLGRIRAASAQMVGQIESLARLAQVATAEVHPELVDLAAVAWAVVAALRRLEPAREVEVEVTGDLEATGDRPLLETLVEALLRNAWHHTPPGPRARIELGSTRQGSEIVYCVRDTGTGFDPTRARHLFEPFGSVHPLGDGELPLAMGLALARRIVHRHGGRIWAEATPGQGAAFSFTLGALYMI